MLAMGEADIIDKVGGTRAVAGGMGETIDNVKKWRTQGIPLKHRRNFRIFAAKHGVALSEAWLWLPVTRKRARAA